MLLMAVGTSERGDPVMVGRSEEEEEELEMLEAVSDKVDEAAEVDDSAEVVDWVKADDWAEVGDSVEVDDTEESDDPVEVDESLKVGTPLKVDDSPKDEDDTPVVTAEPRVVGSSVEAAEPLMVKVCELDSVTEEVVMLEMVEVSSVAVDDGDNDDEDEISLMGVTTGLGGVEVVVLTRESVRMLWRDGNTVEEAAEAVVDDEDVEMAVSEDVVADAVELGVTTGSTLPAPVDTRLVVSEQRDSELSSVAVVDVAVADKSVVGLSVADTRLVALTPVLIAACLGALAALAAGPQGRERFLRGPASAAAASDKA